MPDGTIQWTEHFAQTLDNMTRQPSNPMGGQKVDVDFRLHFAQDLALAVSQAVVDAVVTAGGQELLDDPEKIYFKFNPVPIIYLGFSPERLEKVAQLLVSFKVTRGRQDYLPYDKLIGETMVEAVRKFLQSRTIRLPFEVY